MSSIPWYDSIDVVIVLVMDVAIVVAAALAWVKGGPPERIGGAINLIAAGLAFAVHLVAGAELQSTLLLVVDGILALGFLGLAIRYAALWIGGTMLLQGGQFALHAYYIVSHRGYDRTYAIVNNGVSWGIVGCIVAGALAAWWRNSRPQTV